MLAAGLILYTLFSLAIPVLIIVLIIKLVTRHRDSHNKAKGPFISFRDAMLTTFIVAAGYTGILALYTLPLAMFGDSDEYANQVLASHLISAIALLIAGLAVKHITGKFLMGVGIVLLLGALGPAFQTLGSAGALLAVLLAFAVLIVITVKVSRKARIHG